MSAALDQVQKKAILDFYQEHGYYVLKSVLSPEECSRYIEEADKIQAQKKSNYVPLMNIDRENEALRALMKHPKVVDVLELLQGGPVSGLQSMLYYKAPGSLGRDLHQDNHYAQAAYGKYLGTWIPLMDADRENGGLIVYPGSHKEDLLGIREDEARQATNEAGFKNDRGFMCDIPEKYELQYAETPAGSCVFIHGNLVHGSEENISESRYRYVYACHYISEGEKFIPGTHANRTPVPLRD